MATPLIYSKVLMRPDSEKYMDLSSEVRERNTNADKTITNILSVLPMTNKDEMFLEMLQLLKLSAEKLRNLEILAEKRRRSSNQQMTGNYKYYLKSEEHFKREITSCRDIFQKFFKTIDFGTKVKNHSRLHSKELFGLINNFCSITNKKYTSEKQKDLNFYLGQLMIRFGGVCENENIKHNLPIAPALNKNVRNITPPELPPPLTALIRKKIDRSKHIVKAQVEIKPTVVKQMAKIQMIQVEENSVTSSETNVSLKNDKNITEVETPTAFVKEYCIMNNQQPKYDNLGTVNTLWSNEYIYNCKVLKYAGEGHGKKRIVAKQSAAANLMKTIILKQKRGKLAQELKPLTIEVLELAIRLMSEYLPFDQELEKISSAEYQKPPIYTPLLNTPGNYIRCKALGLNAVGYGKSKDIAKRMSAKLIIDRYQEIKHQKKELKPNKKQIK